MTLTYTNDKGLTFTRTISVDERYMFTVADKISNAGQAPASLSSYGRVTRYNKPTTPSVYVLHEGFIGVIGDDGLIETKYSRRRKGSRDAGEIHRRLAWHYRQILGGDDRSAAKCRL
ncbi:YidC/Oxa1 family membrane protein insertase [Rhizobium ruizarguesonis]